MYSSEYQFGFESGFSTSLCTGIVKNVVSRYIHNGSAVLGCFLDASKAFDMVDHGILFQKLINRGLPSPITRFLLSWYRTQKMRVWWESSYSDAFNVSNGVRQGSVLSPALFAVYLDGLLNELHDSSVGCYWGCKFAGTFCYADDIVLLAPCASAMRYMLNICNTYACSHGLEFNANKSQLICFRLSTNYPHSPTIHFNDTILQFSDQVTHLGHLLTYNLDDRPDIIRVVKDINCKANSVLCTFSSADPFVKCYLIKSYCLSLYGCVLWMLHSPALKTIEVALNKILRKVWNLPRQSHTSVVHCVAQVSTISNLLIKQFCSLFTRAISSSSCLVRTIFYESSQLMYSFTGYNHMCGQNHLRIFSDHDFNAASIIRYIHGLYSLQEVYIKELACE